MNNNGFQTTHWSVVLAARGDETAAGVALRELCETYYDPVLRYVERTVAGDAPKTYGGRDARDLTHDFFSRMLEEKSLAPLRREGGRFRSYLLGAVKHFLSHVRETESRSKRGGDVRHVSLEDDRLAVRPLEDAAFDRDWAQSLLKNVYERLGTSLETRTLLPWLTRELDGESRRNIAGELGMTDVAVKVALHRLRKHFRETIRARIAETVENATEIDGELDHLVKALRNAAPGQSTSEHSTSEHEA